MDGFGAHGLLKKTKSNWIQKKIPVSKKVKNFEEKIDMNSHDHYDHW